MGRTGQILYSVCLGDVRRGSVYCEARKTSASQSLSSCVSKGGECVWLKAGGSEVGVGGGVEDRGREGGGGARGAEPIGVPWRMKGEGTQRAGKGSERMMGMSLIMSVWDARAAVDKEPAESMLRVQKARLG